MYPKPVENFATFNFYILEKGNTLIKILDINGRLVKNIEKKNLPTGQNTLNIDLSNLEKGVYTYNIEQNGAKSSNYKFIKK